MKEEALKLADELQDYMTSLGWKTHQAPDMIRRLVERIDSQDKHLQGKDDLISRLVEELDRNKIYIQKMEDALGCDVSYYEPLNKPVNPFAWVDSIGTFVTNSDYKELPERLKEDMIPLYTAPHHASDVKQTKPLSDEEIGDCVDDYFGLMALQHKYTYSIDQVQEYGLKLCKAIEERHGIK